MSKKGKKGQKNAKGPTRYDKQAAAKAKKAKQGGAAGPLGQQREPSDIPLGSAATAAADPSPVVTLRPMAPIISRSGRPFDDQAGPDGVRFPPPSSLAGCLRTAWARQENQPFGTHLLDLPITGPLLARPAADGRLRLFAPRPADALYFGPKGAQRCVRALPKPFTPDLGADLPDLGADLPDHLIPVQLAESPAGKETKGPAWWAWEDLIAFRDGKPLSFKQLEEQGWTPPEGDRRTHVAIEPSTLAAKTGQLFQTEGLDLSPTRGIQDDPASDFRLLAMLDRPLGPAMAHLGGERRLARIEPREVSAWPVMPANWISQIRQAGGLSLTLLTPALFRGGYRPGWLVPGGDPAHPSHLVGSPPAIDGLKLALRAAALGRWQPHSGWDLAHQQPRAGRKLAPAGAVYWLALVGQPSDHALAALWLASLCDLEQDRRDGFGLALPAPWSPVDHLIQSKTA